MQKKRIDRSVDVDAISDEDVLDTTNPRHDNQGHEQKFLHMLDAAKELRQRFSGLNKSPSEIATEIGVEPNQENLAMIEDLMKSRMFSQGMFAEGNRRCLLGPAAEKKIRQIVTEAVAEVVELDERWREDDESEWHKSIAGNSQQATQNNNAGTTAGTSSAETVQKARQLVALATQIASRKNPAMAKHISTLASQFEDLAKQPNPENTAKAMKLASQISSLAKSLK